MVTLNTKIPRKISLEAIKAGPTPLPCAHELTAILLRSHAPSFWRIMAKPEKLPDFSNFEK
jgi:hypothetical protein